MKFRFLILSLLVLFLINCEKSDKPVMQDNKNPMQVENNEGGYLKGEILEILQTPSYTYLNLKEDNGSKWIAVTKMEAKVGETIFYFEGMEMKNFESKTLNKTFPSVWFVSKAGLSEPTATMNPHQGMQMNQSPHSKNTSSKVKLTLEKSDKDLTIAQVFENPEKYSDKEITIKGKVTKFNANIMDRNWIHIQDGTEFNGKYDLTVTSTQSCKPGDILVFVGTVHLNKDFGAGYKYDIILEDTKIK